MFSENNFFGCHNWMFWSEEVWRHVSRYWSNEIMLASVR